MRLSTSDDFERALWRSGDDLYHLALLLSPDEQRAGRALVSAIHQVALAGAVPDEPTLIGALVASLPAERGLELLPILAAKIRRPSWTRTTSDHRDQAPLLRAIAALPRRARLALGLSLLRPFDPAQAAAMLGGDELAVREQIRDALVALAPYALPDTSPELFEVDGAPEACRPTRAALALGATALQESGSARAHLALCAECRATEQAWGKLTTAVEAGLRGAMRPLHVPPALNAQLHAAAQPNQAQAQGMLDQPWKRIALVALPVLAAIAFLVLPRGAPAPAPSTGGSGEAAPPAADLQQLVRRAQAQLYRPQPNPAGAAGGTTWHTQYSLQWNFPDGSSAELTGNIWIDPPGGRHRVQIAHRSGGGPYEFELADGRGSAWYAATPNYAPAIYPFGSNGTINRAQLNATPEQQAAMLDARLRAGAWRTAPAYLDQAARAELRTWGRQRDADGRFLTLISFRGISPLGFPSGAPEAAGAETTILLAIDADGRLREVRELAGATGAEQTARTTWRLDSEEWVDVAEEANAVFDLQHAWNGIGNFIPLGAPASLALPLIEAQRAVSLGTLTQYFQDVTFLPAAPPPGADSAIALNLASDGQLGRADGRMPLIYVGKGRSLALRTIALDQLSEPIGGGESVTIDGKRGSLKPALGQVYNASLLPDFSPNQAPVAVLISASGYTRDEMLGVLRSLAPPTLEVYRAQAGLFYDTHPKDAAFEALLGALAPAPATPSGSARHFVERAYKRQMLGATDPLSDPYHRRPYGGWPDHWTQNNWARGDASQGTLETWSSNLADDGALLARQYRGPAAGWDYDALASRVFQYPASLFGPAHTLAEEQGSVLRMLSCGEYALQTKSDGARSIRAVEPNGVEQSCQHPEYGFLANTQQGIGPSDAHSADQTPFVADLRGRPLTTVIDLGSDGRAVRTQVWAGPPEQGGTLIESWERVGEELTPASGVPAETLSTEPPEALLRWEYPRDGEPPAFPRQIAITEALSLVPSTLFVLPNSAPASIYAGANPNQPRVNQSSSDTSIFDLAMVNGYAIRFTYAITQADLVLEQRVFEGPSATLGAYLRDNARWIGSAPIKLNVGGRAIDGWSVTSPADPSFGWLLFEQNGTLVAVEQSTRILPSLIQELRPVTR